MTGTPPTKVEELQHNKPPAEPSSFRWLAGSGEDGGEAAEWLIIAIAAGVLFARVMLAEPLQSANDRSRWCTVFSLVEDGTYRIDRIASHPRWDTIDKVLHEGHFYSSKPPLLATIVAGLYWLVKRTLGWDLWSDTAAVARLVLLVINWLPWVLALVALRSILHRWRVTTAARIGVLLLAGFGCLVIPFLTTLNNHTVATTSLVFALWGLLRIVEQPPATNWLGFGRGGTADRPPLPASADDTTRMDEPGVSGQSPVLFAWTGFWAAMVACHELPAALWGIAAWWLCLRRSPHRTWLCFVPAALVPLAAFFVTNYLATGGWKPFYAYYGTEKYRYVVDGVPSYWMNPQGIDRGAESPVTYLFHCLVGHHGILSLFPAWLLTLHGWWLALRPGGGVTAARDGGASERRVGGVAAARDTARLGPSDAAEPEVFARVQRTVAALGILLTTWVLAFYLSRTANYNYGGVSTALRWAIWLTPLWLLPMTAALERWLAWQRPAIALLGLMPLFGISAFSATYPFANPWQQPWLFVVLERWGWIDYRERPAPFPRPVWSWVVNPLPADDGGWVELAGYDETGAPFVIRIADRGRVISDARSTGDAATRRRLRWLEIRWQTASDERPVRHAAYVVDVDAWLAGKELREYVLWPRPAVPLRDVLGEQPPAAWLPDTADADAERWLNWLRGVPVRRPYYPGLIRYLKTPARPEAFRCQRSATQVLFTPAGRTRPLRYRCDLWICPEVPFGIAQVEWTVWDVDHDTIVHRSRATVRAASGWMSPSAAFIAGP